MLWLQRALQVYRGKQYVLWSRLARHKAMCQKRLTVKLGRKPGELLQVFLMR